MGLGSEPGASPRDKNFGVAGVCPWGTQWPPPKGAGNYAGEDDGWSSKITGYTDGSKYTAKVGSYPPNRLGIFDLGGNVWEWCEDWYDGERKARVLRGASFLNEFPAVLLSSSRFNHAPDGRHDNFGFRCVVVVGGSAP